MGNTLKFSIPTMVSAVVSILTITLVTRLYPTEQYGFISLFYSVGTLLASVSMLGLVNACIRFFYDPLAGGERKDTFNFAFWTGCTVALILAFFTFLFGREKISTYLFGEDNTLSLIIFFIYIITNILYRLQSNYARLSQNAMRYNVQQIIYILSNKILFVFAVLISTNYFYSVLFIVLAMVLEVVLIGRKSYKPSISFPDKKARIQYLKFSIPMLPNEIAVTLNNSAVKILLSYFEDFSSLGIISMGTNVANTFNLISSAFGVYWSSFMYENYKKEQKLICNVHNACILIAIFLLCGIIILQDVLYMMLGEEYRASQKYFMLIMLLPIQGLICETTSYGISISKKTHITMILAIIACLLNIAIGYFLYPYLGAMAMAIGIAASAVFQLIFRTIYGQRYYKSIKSKRQTIPGFIILILLCVTGPYTYNNLGLRLCTVLIALVITFLIFKHEAKYILNYILNFNRKNRQ